VRDLADEDGASPGPACIMHSATSELSMSARSIAISTDLRERIRRLSTAFPARCDLSRSCRKSLSDP